MKTKDTRESPNLQETSLDSAKLTELISQLSDLVASRKVPSITFGELWKLFFEKHVMLKHKNTANARYFYQRYGSAYSHVPVDTITR